MTEYLRAPVAAPSSSSYLLDASDFAAIVDSELYEPGLDTNAQMLVVMTASRPLRATTKLVQRVVQPLTLPAAATPTNVGMLVVRPRPSLARPRANRSPLRVYAPIYASPHVDPFGPAGVATLVLDTQRGATTTYSWSTNVLRGVNGTEHRVCLATVPRESYEWTVIQEDQYFRGSFATLFVNLAQGAIFRVAMMHEAATITNSGTGTVVTVNTADLDWAVPGQRCATYAPNDTTPTNQGILTATIQSVTATTITFDSSMSFGVNGTILMPTRACVLDPVQQIGHYASGGSEWSFRARAVEFGVNGSWAPAGGHTPDQAFPDGWYIYDRMIEAESTVSRALQSEEQIIDRGGAITAYGQQATSTFVRNVRTTLRTRADFQWWKGITERGCLYPFHLPTWKPDFDFLTDASTGSFRFTSTGLTGTDYIGTFKNNPAYSYLQFLKLDGTISYMHIFDATDNGDGTQTIVLDSPVVGALKMVSFLELVRWNTDAFTIEWDGTVGFFEAQAIVVTE